MGAATDQRRPTLGAAFGWLLLGALATVLVALAAGSLATGLGSGYYLLPFEARPDHPYHDLLRPGGRLGVLLGVVGTGLMLAMLSYTVRKWLPLGFPGSPAWWLRFHMLCGVMGPTLIVLHGGLYLPSGIVAVAFWCMVAVALSGVFGRYVYGHFPRTAAGLEMTASGAKASLADLRAELVAMTAGADAERLGAAVTLASDLDREVLSVFGLAGLDLEVRRRARRVRSLLAGAPLPPDVRSRATTALLGQLRMRRNLAGWQVSRRLFRYWHLFHEPLAKAMYLIVAWHVFNAVIFGGALLTLLSWFGA